jgi:DNA-directed RNA polymerase specialized sigma24 family protein
LEQKSYAEIVEEMNMPLNTVKVLVHRAKISLKVILEKQGFKN